MTYQNAEPEMVLNTFAWVAPPFFLGGTIQPIVAPWNGVTPRPWFVQVCEADPHTWRGDLSLLQLLRRNNKDGQVLDCLQRERRRDYPEEMCRSLISRGRTGSGKS